ncbi:hypothetical protein F5148DRAFT_975010 [Russula earlei]|uniref:Uncharacterized protein n=1 Tax=Russula earlei TaxID=71964 RepID=A0ACC0UKD8_9AGAM|nr:hypothetical protein F5148DRAFT_975010 [Russula earlei]
MLGTTADDSRGSKSGVTPSGTTPYVREAKPSDIPALADVYTRAFARDPMMNWFGNVGELVRADHLKGGEKVPSTARRTLESLHHFQLVLMKMTQISGLIVVVVEREDGGQGGQKEATATERVVGGVLWLKPGTSMNPSPLTLGYFSLTQRTSIEFGPEAEKVTDEVFAARGLRRLNSWHVFEIAIDPACEGKGYASLLLRDGFERASGKPMHLEATTPRSRDIYAHLGFEAGRLNGERRFGVGSVDERGIVAKGEAAVGWPVFFMTKVCSLSLTGLLDN